MRTTILTRYNIKNVTSNQLKDIADNSGRASLIVSPTGLNLWNVSICLKEEEIQRIRNLGFNYEKIPG